MSKKIHSKKTTGNNGQEYCAKIQRAVVRHEKLDSQILYLLSYVGKDYLFLTHVTKKDECTSWDAAGEREGNGLFSRLPSRVFYVPAERKDLADGVVESARGTNGYTSSAKLKRALDKAIESDIFGGNK